MGKSRKKKNTLNSQLESAEKNRALAIVRVSTSEQAHEDRFSIPHQKSHISEECAKRNLDLIHVFEFVQSGAKVLSGSSREREKVIRFIKEQGINYVVVHELDRLARSMLDVLLFVDFLDENYVKFISIHDNFDTSTMQGMLQMQILASFAEYFRKQLAAKVIGGMIERAQKGLPLGKRPIGYRIGPNGYEIIPEEAQVVKKIFDLYVNGNMGLRSIADELNKLGIKSRNNNLWSHTTIRDILENETYIGNFIWGEIRVENRHPAIIYRETFEKVQARRLKKIQLGGRAQNSAFLLSGLLKCANCNEATMVGRTAKKGKYTYKYYRCNNYASKGITACESHEYRADDLEKLVLHDIEELLKQGPAVLATRTTVPSDLVNLQEELKIYEQELQNLDKALDRAASAYESGAYDIDFFTDRKTSITSQKEELKKRIAEISSRLAGNIPPEEIGRRTREKMQAAAQLLKESDTARAKAFLQELIDNIEVKKMDDITIFYRI